MREQRARQIKAAGDAAPVAWKQAASEEIDALISKGAPFTTDDVWKALDARGIEAPLERRGMGQLIVMAQRAGRIVSVGLTTSQRRGGITTAWCARPSAHGEPCTTPPVAAPSVKLVAGRVADDLRHLADRIEENYGAGIYSTAMRDIALRLESVLGASSEKAAARDGGA